MIDKLYQIATMPPEQRVKKEVKSSEMAGKGVEQQREDLGFKKGGFITKGCGKIMSNRRKKTKVY